MENTAINQEVISPAAARVVQLPSKEWGFNPEPAEQFLEILDPGGTFCFQTFGEKTRGLRSIGLARTLTGKLAEHRHILATLNSQGAAVTVTLNRTDGAGRCKENITSMRALFVDLDGADLSALNKIDLRPHLVVETSPGRYHVAYKLAGDYTPEAWMGYCKELARRCGGDVQAAKLTIGMRVPGFLHHKNSPTLVQLLTSSNHPAYHLAAIEAALGGIALPTPMKLTAGRPLQPEEITPRMRAYTAAILKKEVEGLRQTQEGERNAQLNEAAFTLGTLVGAGVLKEAQAEDALTDAASEIGLEPAEIEATLRSGLNAGMDEPRDLSALQTELRPNGDPPQVLGELKRSPKFRKVWSRAAPYGHAAHKDDFALAIEALSLRPALTDQELLDLLHAFQQKEPGTEAYRGEVPSDRDAWADYGQGIIDGARRMLEKRRIDAQDQDNKLTEFLRGFVYLTDGDQYACKETGTRYTTKSFRMKVGETYPDALDGSVDQAFSRAGGMVLLHDTYLPGRPRIVEAEDKNGNRNKLLNTYVRPELPEPKHDAEVERLFLEHLDMISGRSEVFVRYVLDFLATLVQKPGQRINSAPVIIGTKGTGKTFLLDLMQHILGKSNVGAITTGGLQSSFQDALMHSQLMGVEEIKVHEGTLSLMDTLKPYISNARISINRKGLPMVTLDNVTNWLFFSNHDDGLRPDPDERRYCVAISHEPAREPAYFQRLYAKLLTQEGLAAVLHLLRGRDLSKFDPYAPAPLTEARQEMIGSTFSLVEQRLAETIQNREYVGTYGLRITCTPDLLTAEDARQLYESIQRDCEQDHRGKPPSPQQVARGYKKVGAVQLGQKRLGEGKKSRVIALRNIERWQKASEAEIADYFDQCIAKAEAEAGAKPV